VTASDFIAQAGDPLKCSECGDDIDNCECCDEARCPEALCYGCITVALGETMPHPHKHGG
jgi:hypothetical protein